MANWNNPSLSSGYSAFLSDLKSRDDDAAKMFAGTGTNLPDGTIRWNATNNRFEKKVSGSFTTLTSTYAFTAITTTGNASIGGNLAVDGSASFAQESTSVTPSSASNSTSIATTAFVKNQNYAPKASPAFTGNPTAPTQSSSNNSTRLATTAYVKGQGYATLSSPALTGSPTAPSPGSTNDSTRIATTAWVRDNVDPQFTAAANDRATKAPISSPVFTGSPRSVTQGASDNSTKIATTAFVKNQNYAPKASPALTGNPTAPTQSSSNNSTRIATTAFVTTAVNNAQAFPSGTRMLFHQTNAPSGWSKETNSAYNNIALRVTTGTVGSGGSKSFTSAFTTRTVSGNTGSTSAGGSVGNRSLSLNQIASHNHGIWASSNTTDDNADGRGLIMSGGLADLSYKTTGEPDDHTNNTVPITNSQGSGHSHDHSFSGASHNHSFSDSVNIAVKYRDVIIAQKS